MIVKPIPDKNNPGRTYVRINDVPCVFPRNMSTPPAGQEIEVMITGVHYFANEEGTFDKTRPKMLFLREITNSHAAVDHSGFRRADDGTTYAQAYSHTVRIVPGRTGARTDGRRGRAYVRKHDLGRFTVRAEGVDQLQDLECWSSF